ncbi:leucine-rich repeat domain-containing protein [Clostridium hydrogenum]|uniref:leucine-rich repeat domain-containing protein n=1 Tax=Clostridium hydrogenum TaxID=2855764 RepID=UPI001F3843D3|nr:leucine-rich repeat domain-containing protein [Clostridium hydrogenum]
MVILSKSKVYAAYDDTKDVYGNKVWEIKFNQSINYNKLSKNSIIVKDKNGNTLDIELLAGMKDNLLEVLPPDGGYEAGMEYTLLVTNQIYSNTNKALKKEESFNFKVKQYEEKTVVLKNYRLNYAIRTMLDKSYYDPIYKSELDKITDLGLRSCGISDISGIENLVNLQTLYLNNNSITDITPIKNLTNLQNLCLTGNQITDISPIKNLTNLKELSIYDNPISNLEPLKNLNNLKLLYLGKNKTTAADIASLKGWLPNCNIEY